jgi:hypothetical protein
VSYGARDTRPSTPTAKLDSDAFKALEANITKHYKAVTLPTMSTGATDMAFLRRKGMQCFGIGRRRISKIPPRVSPRTATRSEFSRASSIVSSASILTRPSSWRERSSSDGVMTRVLALSALVILSACGESDLKIDFFRSETYTFSWSERRAIEQVAHATLREVRPLLPALPARIQLTVRPGRDVIDETGETASAMSSNAIMWTVNPHREESVAAITEKMAASVPVSRISSSRPMVCRRTSLNSRSRVVRRHGDGI